jgi:hypothetical protein
VKVFFAVPRYSGLKCVPFIDSLAATIKLVADRGHEGQLAIQRGCCYVQVARNELVKQFMDSGFDCLFFLDDDLSWDAEDALRLIEMPDELVAGVYPKKSETDDYPIVIRCDKDDRAIVREDGCIAAPFLPTGFMRIQRSVIEKLQDHYIGQKYEKPDGTPMFDLFPQGVRGGRWWGEDFAFCKLWLDIGGTAWIVPNMTFSHHGSDADGKPKTWTGSYHDFLMRQPGGSKA